MTLLRILKGPSVKFNYPRSFDRAQKDLPILCDGIAMCDHHWVDRTETHRLSFGELQASSTY